MIFLFLEGSAEGNTIDNYESSYNIWSIHFIEKLSHFFCYNFITDFS